MKNFWIELKAAAILTAVFAGLLCGIYPVAVWAGASALFSEKANGSLIVDTDGSVRGSTILAQSFASDRYFLPRPSAAGSGYDAMSSGGSNLGPTSKALADRIANAVAVYRQSNGLNADDPVPADAVTASGSGLDPHISPENAAIQARRVARARGLPLADIQKMMVRFTDDREFGFLGEPGVNVLLLNRALDQLGARK